MPNFMIWTREVQGDGQRELMDIVEASDGEQAYGCAELRWPDEQFTVEEVEVPEDDEPPGIPEPEWDDVLDPQDF